MSNEKLTHTVRSRIPRKMRRQLQRVADARHLELSDIVREALRTYLGSQNFSPMPDQKKAA